MTSKNNYIDLGGNSLIVKSIRYADKPNQLGTEVTSAEAGVIDGVTPGTAAASKAVVTDSNVDVAGLGVVGISRIDWDSGTATLSSNAATITKWSAVITTESLSTAHTASQALVITKTGVAAGDIAFAQIIGGANTGGLPGISKVVCTTNTVTITLTNYAASTNAFNNTFIIGLLIHKA